MFFGSLAVVFCSLVEGYIYKSINLSPNRNFLTAIYYLVSLVVLLLVSCVPLFIFQEDVDFAKELSFFGSKWFYLILFLEIAGAWLYREAYHVHKNNFTVVNMFMFSTVFLMPLYAYMMNIVTSDLNHSVTAITSLDDALVTSAILFVGTFIYFADKLKIKGAVDYKLLVVLSFCMLNTMYFSTKIIQSYNGLLLYVFILLIIMLNFLVLAYKNKEKFKLEGNTKNTPKLLIYKSIAQVAYLKGVEFIPAELAPVVRRLSQLLSGLIVDKQTLNKTELLGIFIIVSVFAYNLFVV